MLSRPTGDGRALPHLRPVVRLRALSLVAGLALVATSCASGLAFVQDDRLEITAPDSHSDVTLPVTIRWTVHDFNVTGPSGTAEPAAGYFGVFVNKSPMPPGRPLSWIARDDRQCDRVPGCPDATYLADRGVYATSDTSITFRQLPDQNVFRGEETHEITIVLLDGKGNRIGESAWYVVLFYDRPER